MRLLTREQTLQTAVNAASHAKVGIDVIDVGVREAEPEPVEGSEELDDGAEVLDDEVIG